MYGPGQTSHQIAVSPYVSPFTVKTHCSASTASSGSEGCTEALFRALEALYFPDQGFTLTYLSGGVASGIRKPSGTSSIGKPDAASMRPLRSKNEIRAVAS